MGIPLSLSLSPPCRIRFCGAFFPDLWVLFLTYWVWISDLSRLKLRVFFHSFFFLSLWGFRIFFSLLCFFLLENLNYCALIKTNLNAFFSATIFMGNFVSKMMQFLHRRNLKLHFLLFPTDFGALEEGKKRWEKKRKNWLRSYEICCIWIQRIYSCICCLFCDH